MTCLTRPRAHPMLAAIIVVVTLTAGLANASPSHAATCYGAACTGLNPSSTSCMRDAKTVGAIDVKGDGILALRWSRSCNATWGRFSSYWRTDVSNSAAGTGITYARVTVWIPGQRSQKVVDQVISAAGSSWWTAMVDGRPRNCTGVELFAQDRLPGRTSNGNQSLGWTWGPCA